MNKWEDKKNILLKKPRSRTKILFRYDKFDDWFVDVVHFEPKSGKENRVSHITGRGFSDWLESYLNDGWIIDNDDIK